MSSSSLNPGSAKATPKRARKSEAPSTASSAPEVHTPAKRPKYDRSVPGKELLWSPELDEVLEDGLRKFPSAMGKQTVDVDGHQLGRTALVAEYILRRTGKNRSRGQVGSRVQFLRHRYSDDKTLVKLFTTSETTNAKLVKSLDFEALLGPRQPTTLAAIAAASESAPAAAAGLDPTVYLTRRGLLEEEIVVDVDAPRSTRKRAARSVASTSERGSSVAPSEAASEEIVVPKSSRLPKTKPQKEEEEPSTAEDTPKRRAAATPRKSTTRTPRASSNLAVDSTSASSTPARRSARKSIAATSIPPVPVLVVQSTLPPEDDSMDAEEQGAEELIISEEVRIGTSLGDGQVMVAQTTPAEQAGWLGKAKGAFWSLVGF